MKIAITGGTGFVGRHIARALLGEGHDVVVVARGEDRTDSGICQTPGVRFFPTGLDDCEKLRQAFANCESVAHCAGINREIGRQTFRSVHVEGTRTVVDCARRAGVKRIALVSFLRARPGCGSGYHESKWAAEEIVRHSGLDYTVFKCGVIYGKGDHMLDHLSRAFRTFPVFAFVGFVDKAVRPIAVEDVARIFKAALVDRALPRKTVAVLGPEVLTLRNTVRKVARLVGRNPWMFPMPLWFHYGFGWLLERIMSIPLVSVAQIRMLSEGLAEALPACDALPAELAPRISFNDEQILRGLPAPGPFGCKDLRCCRPLARRGRSPRRVFLELP